MRTAYDGMDTANKRAAGLYRYRLGLDHVPRRFPTTRRRFPTQPGAASPQPGGASHSPAPLSRLVGRPGHAATGEKFSQRAATRVSRSAAAPRTGCGEIQPACSDPRQPMRRRAERV